MAIGPDPQVRIGYDEDGEEVTIRLSAHKFTQLLMGDAEFKRDVISGLLEIFRDQKPSITEDVWFQRQLTQRMDVLVEGLFSRAEKTIMARYEHWVKNQGQTMVEREARKAVEELLNKREGL